jgi:alginate O-acetyltransferase complex protein AlgI
VFFRADSFTHAVAILGAMAGLSPAAPTAFSAGWYLTPELLLALTAGIIGSTPIVPALARLRAHPLPAVAHAALLVLLAASVMLIAARTYNPFIYFRF